METLYYKAAKSSKCGTDFFSVLSAAKEQSLKAIEILKDYGATNLTAYQHHLYSSCFEFESSMDLGKGFKPSKDFEGYWGLDLRTKLGKEIRDRIQNETKTITRLELHKTCFDGVNVLDGMGYWFSEELDLIIVCIHEKPRVKPKSDLVPIKKSEYYSIIGQ